MLATIIKKLLVQLLINHLTRKVNKLAVKIEKAQDKLDQHRIKYDG